MSYNKKAQIGATMNWIVATLIIILILSISLLVTSLTKTRGEVKIDKGMDLFAVKSISYFLMQKENFELIDKVINEKGEVSKEEIKVAEEKIKSFLREIQSYEGYNLQIYFNNELKKEIINHRVRFKSESIIDSPFIPFDSEEKQEEILFEFIEGTDETLLRFWEEKQ